MDASLFYMLHDAADDNIAIFVTESIHIQLICPIQVLVYQHRPVGVHFDRILDVSLQILVTVQTRLAWREATCWMGSFAVGRKTMSKSVSSPPRMVNAQLRGLMSHANFIFEARFAIITLPLARQPVTAS